MTGCVRAWLLVTVAWCCCVTPAVANDAVSAVGHQHAPEAGHGFEAIESRVRAVVFGEHTAWPRCDAGESVAAVGLVGRPVEGTFTRPGAQQVLFQFVFDPCEESWPSPYPQRFVVVEDGVVIQVVDGPGVAYYESVSVVESVDVDGDGIDELLLRRNVGPHYSEASITSLGADGLRTIVWFAVAEDNFAEFGPFFAATSWSASIHWVADDGGQHRPALDFTVFEALSVVSPAQRADWDAQLEAARSRREVDPVGAAVAILDLAWAGSAAAQREVAGLYERGEILPLDAELAAWWQERAESSALADAAPGR